MATVHASEMQDEPSNTSTSTPPTDGIPKTFGIALSGGGVRAAFYALGGLMYLVRSGLNSRVTFMASVSGGSIVNAAVASWGDFSLTDPEAFEGFVGRFSSRMANRGVFFLKSVNRALLAIASLFIYPFLMTVGNGEGWGFSGEWSWSLFSLYTVLYVPWMMVFFVCGRGRFQRSTYADFIAHAVSPERRVRRQIAKSKLRDFPASSVRHILVATELTSGEPLYMDREMIYSQAYGTGRPLLTVAEAVYASAAFPIGFPPLRIKTTAIQMANGRMEDRPDNLVAADGGVFNNLGTDTFTAWDAVRSSPLVTQENFPEAPEQVIVINASSPPQIEELSNLRVKRNLVAARRIISIMYENTLRPRIQRLTEQSLESGGPLVVDIADSPVELAMRMETGPWCEAATSMMRQLRADRTDSDWAEFTTRAAKTKTVLTPIGEVAAARLIRLGYINTAVACSIRFGTVGLTSVPSEHDITTLLKRHETAAPVVSRRGTDSEVRPVG